jgi:hypothetical protein
MSLLFLFRLALAEPSCDIAAAILAVRDQGSQEAYLCLAADHAAPPALREAIAANPGNNARLSRGLAIWLLSHRDSEWTVENTSVLQPSDIRLLNDGIKAARGRKSPVPEHDKVFAQFDWYQPLPNYTDGRLREVDHANLTLLLAKPEVAAASAVVPQPERQWSRVIVPALFGGVGLVGAAFAFFRFRRS